MTLKELKIAALKALVMSDKEVEKMVADYMIKTRIEEELKKVQELSQKEEYEDDLKKIFEELYK